MSAAPDLIAPSAVYLVYPTFPITTPSKTFLKSNKVNNLHLSCAPNPIPSITCK